MPAVSSRGLAITNPLVHYRALIATNFIKPDPAQHRLAIHLQKLYERLKDYDPTVEYKERLNQITRAVGSQDVSAIPPEANRTGSRGIWTSLLGQKEKRDSLALTRVLTSHEAALQLDSPKGLMLHGEVGTGKSMLIDLFADCLPTRKKRRWHFNTFMLETFAKLEHLRRSRLSSYLSANGSLPDDDYSLLWLARDMIKTSPILFLDEFQLPDRAASKIMSNLMTSFFHLGGVLIATSNRMPEELAKAAGMEFAPPPSSRRGFLGRRFGLGAGGIAGGRGESMFAGQAEFAAFLEVLKARCDVWEMEGVKDYRRSEAEEGKGSTSRVISTSEERNGHKLSAGESTTIQSVQAGETLVSSQGGLALEPVVNDTRDLPAGAAMLPKCYFVKPPPDEPTAWDVWQASSNAAQLRATNPDLNSADNIPWTAGSMRVYGHTVRIPRHYKGTTSWTFAELCGSQLGPADYITLASTFHTLILTDVPVLTLFQKNEARRFITLLDALYEARCKLLITAATGPDELFFPEARAPAALEASGAENVDQDAVYAETFAEAYQDATAPFRPNVASYSGGEPDYTHARLQGILADDALEDDPPNRVRRGASFSVDAPEPAMSRPGPNFAQAGAFTGEDERFAYKRARSRLWEMCGAKWWARNEEGWWRPVSKDVRRWEVSHNTTGITRNAAEQAGLSGASVGEGIGASRGIDEKNDEVLYRHGASPFRTHAEPPPKISWTHVWGTMKWGKRAGAWGQGVEGLAERKKEKDG